METTLYVQTENRKKYFSVNNPPFIPRIGELVSGSQFYGRVVEVDLDYSKSFLIAIVTLGEV